MIWHIFRKDLRLFWRLAAAVVALQGALSLTEFLMGPHERTGLGTSQQALEFALALSLFGFVVLLIQQDGFRKAQLDWLIRPIRRTDLLLGKTLLIAVTILLPMALIDLVQCLATGFPLLASAGATFTRSLFLLVDLIIPAIAVAAITRNIAATAATCIIYLLGFYEAVSNLTSNSSPDWFLWIIHPVQYLLFGIGAVVAIVLQCGYRRIIWAQFALPVFILAGVLIDMLPLDWIYAAQHSVTPQSIRLSKVALQFVPDQPRVPSGDKRDYEATVLIPVSVTGLPKGTAVWNEWNKIDFLAPDGRTVQTVKSNGGSVPMFELRGEGDRRQTYLRLYLTRDIEQALLEQPFLSLRLDYAMTVVEPDGDKIDIARSPDIVEVPNLGKCQFTPKEEGALGMGLDCLQLGHYDEISRISVADPRSEQPVGDSPWSYSENAPLFLQMLPNAIRRDQHWIFAKAGQTERDMREGRIEIVNYRPLAHVRAQLTVPDFKLADWM